MQKEDSTDHFTKSARDLGGGPGTGLWEQCQDPRKRYTHQVSTRAVFRKREKQEGSGKGKLTSLCPFACLPSHSVFSDFLGCARHCEAQL